MIVSVIVACRNEARDIRCFLDSVLAQSVSGTDWEIILADGMSSDGTREILQQYARSDRRVRVVDNPGRIVSTGLNAALQASRGETLLRMNAHTNYAPDYI